MIDSHCHLNMRPLLDSASDLIAEATEAGVHTIINVGADLESSEKAVALAAEYDACYAVVGIHPHDAKTCDARTLDRIRDLAAMKKVVAIGEIGLDYYRDLSPRDIQGRAFRQQLELAIELKMPIVIHTRDAMDDTIDIVREYAFDLPGGVFHCFPGTVDEAEIVFALGFHISVGGVISYKNAGMAKVAAAVPLDRLLLETDAPYLTPMPFRGNQNKPSYVTLVAEKLTELRTESFLEIERETDRNCQKLFRLVDLFEG
jgi:TatD DNase family protein